MRRALAGALLAFAVAGVPGTAAAHAGTDGTVTSNYRTRIRAVEPAVPGLTVRVADLDGRIELRYDGPGELIVDGYEGEPYLRFDADGVSRNRRSPATYLNEDRYAQVTTPAVADAGAAPEWDRLTAGRSYRWHDHRTHWMSPVPPAEVDADPGRQHVIYDRWTIPLAVTGDGEPVSASVIGDLTWVPPPSSVPWFAAAAAVAIVVGSLLFRPTWRHRAAIAATVGTVAFAADSIGYVIDSDARWDNRLFILVAPLVAVVATARLWVHARRATPTPTLAMSVVALLLAVLGGLDRADTFDHSLIASALPGWVARLAACLSLGIGVALLARFLAFLVPAAAGRGPRAVRQTAP